MSQVITGIDIFDDETPSVLHIADYGKFELFPELIDIHSCRQRMVDILYRFVRAEDKPLSDRDFMHTIFKRWAKDQDVHLGDPNE